MALVIFQEGTDKVYLYKMGNNRRMVTQFTGPAFGRFQQTFPLQVKECSPEDFLTKTTRGGRNQSPPVGLFYLRIR